MQEEFKKKAKSKLGKKKRKPLDDDKEERLKTQNAHRLRHAGVLGMCAFIQANPYDIPEHIPPIFECLSYNLNDPEPIPVSELLINQFFINIYFLTYLKFYNIYNRALYEKRSITLSVHTVMDGLVFKAYQKNLRNSSLQFYKI